ncbi:MAG: ATP-binding protein [Ferruginibacter sp.]|nr:ATP-binding protein [Cytophagales bacterium]
MKEPRSRTSRTPAGVKTLDATVPILKVVERTFDKLKESKLSERNQGRILAKLNADVERVAHFLQCEKDEALFFIIIFGLKVVTNSVYYHDIIQYLDCNPFFIVSHENIFKNLQKKRLIVKDDNWGKTSSSINVTREAYNAVANNKPFHGGGGTYENVYTLLQKVDDLIVERRRDVISTAELFEEVQYMVYTDSNILLTRNLRGLNLNVREVTLLLYLSYQFANGDEYVEVNEMLGMIFDTMGDKINMKKELINKDAEVVKKGLVEFENDYFLMGRSIKLTDKAIEQLFANETEIFDRKKGFKPQNSLLIDHENLKSKKLFFNEEEKRQTTALKQLLTEEKLDKVLDKFEAAGMPKGIVVLLYGDPGTGKTETVYYLAKRTGRNILMVDIASIKDKYVGESEKHIKQLFENYRKAREYYKKDPILLFNESDAIISKRIEVTTSVDQMNNSMQNILLQELENFEGILFATSNLNVNLDKAFERRFLYKIQFKKPDAVTREKIWADKLPDLVGKDVRYLARGFDFSGGQIDNVARKYILENILNDAAPSLQALEKLCQDEVFGQSAAKIGF